MWGSRLCCDRFLEQCVAGFIELANSETSRLRKVAAPFLDLEPQDSEELGGALQAIPSKALLKIRFARVARYDLLCAACRLASEVTKWTTACDKPLHSLVTHINLTLDTRIYARVGHSSPELTLRPLRVSELSG